MLTCKRYFIHIKPLNRFFLVSFKVILVGRGFFVLGFSAKLLEVLAMLHKVVCEKCRNSQKDTVFLADIFPISRGSFSE